MKRSKSYEYTSWGIRSVGTDKENIEMIKRALELVFGVSEQSEELPNE